MIDQMAMNQTQAENFMRSATAPEIKAGVMMANIIWNTMKAPSGIESPWIALPTPTLSPNPSSPSPEQVSGRRRHPGRRRPG